MSLIRKLINRLRYGASGPPIVWREGIVISTPHGPVPERFRRQACINMRLDPYKFMEVERVILAECKGDWEKTKATMKSRYPEACPEGY